MPAPAWSVPSRLPTGGGPDDPPGPTAQAPFFADQGIPSVDNIDTAGGAIALVYALAGADGRFGYGDDADAVLPPGPRVVR